MSRQATKPPVRGTGVWVPQSRVESLRRLDLHHPSTWRVYLTILLTACRYGKGVAWLKIRELIALTGLSRCTVLRAVAELLTKGVIRRDGRYGRFTVEERAASPVPSSNRTESTGSLNKIRLPKSHHDETSPTTSSFSLSSLGIKESTPAVFTPRQAKVIDEVMAEVRQELGSNPWDLDLSGQTLKRLGLTGSITYRNALTIVIANNDKAQARAFVGAVLSLKTDPRVQGVEILPMRPKRKRA